jgi:hypothetical protein
MKALILLTLFMFTDKYSEQMIKNIEVVYNNSSIEDIQKSVNTFDRIGSAEKTKWEPYYYASFGYIMMAVREQDATKKDALLDLAATAIDKATAIKANESEIVTLEGFIHMIRVSVDPASRGQKYSTLAMQSYGKALGINPQNPRALALMAQLQFGTARFFKQEPVEACQTATKALALFDSKPFELAIAPSWGRGMTEELVKGCK